MLEVKSIKTDAILVIETDNGTKKYSIDDYITLYVDGMEVSGEIVGIGDNYITIESRTDGSHINVALSKIGQVLR